jgi:hypothetical protein
LECFNYYAPKVELRYFSNSSTPLLLRMSCHCEVHHLRFPVLLESCLIRIESAMRSSELTSLTPDMSEVLFPPTPAIEHIRRKRN